MGATQASAGMLAPYTEAKDRNNAFLDLAVRSLGLYDDFVAGLVAATNIQVGYHRTGTLEVATSERTDGGASPGGRAPGSPRGCTGPARRARLHAPKSRR